MKSILTRIGLRSAVGVYIDDEAVHASRVFLTPFVPVEGSYHSLPAARGAVKELLRPFLGRGR